MNYSLEFQTVRHGKHNTTKHLTQNSKVEPIYSIIIHMGFVTFLCSGLVTSVLQGNIETEKGKLPCLHKLLQEQFVIVNAFGLWEETRVPGGNSCMYRERLQTLCRKTPEWDLNP